MIEEKDNAENLPQNERQSANWDIRNAPRNYLALVLTQFGSAFFAFASVWLISKRIGSEGYGGVVAIIAASQVAQILVNWTVYSVVRFGTEEFVESAKISRIFWLRLFVLLPNFLLVLLASQIWFPPLADWLKLPAESFWFVILHFAATALWLHVQFSLQGAKLPRVQGYLLMLERILIFGGIAVLLVADKISPLSALLCYAISPLLMAFIGTIYLRRLVFARFSVDWQFIKKIVAYSVPLLPFSLVGYFSGSYVDAIFVSKFLSVKDLGIYSVATQINGIALQLPTLANSLLLPMFVTLQSESQNERTQNYFQNILPSLTLIWGLFCVALSFIGYFTVPLIFGADFNEAVYPLWILLSSSVVALPALLGYFPLSHSISTTYISMIGAFFSALTNVVANMIFIPKYGMVGCAVATFLSYLVNIALTIILLKRVIEIQVSWSFTAMIPATVSLIVILVTKNSLLALLICLGISFFVSWFYKKSLFQTFDVFKNTKLPVKIT